MNQQQPIRPQLPKTPAPVNGRQVCTYCKKPIDKYHDGEIESRWEKKWSQHWACRDQVFNMITRMTPGR